MAATSSKSAKGWRQAAAESRRGTRAVSPATACKTWWNTDLGGVPQLVHCLVLALHQLLVKGVFETALGFAAVETIHVGLVVAEQQFVVCFGVKVIDTKYGIARRDGPIGFGS